MPIRLSESTHRQYGEHHLGHVEGVPPVVVCDVPVILLDGQQPPAQHLVVHVEALHDVQVEEHPDAGLWRRERDVAVIYTNGAFRHYELIQLSS